MLLLTALIQVLPSLAIKAIASCNYFGLDRESILFQNVCTCIEIIIYVVAFLLPILFILHFTPPCPLDISFRPSFPKKMPLVTVGTMGLIALLGRVAVWFNSVFEKFGIGIRDASLTLPKDVWGVILLIIYSAIVPAIVEEILFRKVILGRLLPYGNVFAVISSAVLFSAMHCNPSQFLYTFVGGIIFGVVAIKTNSVVPTMVIHFFNNMLSVIYMTLYSFAPYNYYSIIVYTIDTVISFLGLLVIYKLIKSNWSPTEHIRKEKELNEAYLDFSPTLSCPRLFVILYALYSIFLTARWIYII